MRIVKSPTLQTSMVELEQYPAAPMRRFIRRIDRILGGEPAPIKPVRTYTIPGPMSYSHGLLELESGENLDIGVKLKEPILDNLTGFMLEGMIPLCREGNVVEFHVDHVDRRPRVEPIL